MKKTIVAAAAATAAATAVLTPGSASAAIPEPTWNQLTAESLITCQYNNNTYEWEVRGDSLINWKKAPKKRGLHTEGHYLMIKTSLWGDGPGVVGGPIKLDSKTYESGVVSIHNKARLPRKYYGLRARYDSYPGADPMTWWTKTVVRVVRSIPLFPDATAWKTTDWSLSAMCTGRSGG